MFVTKTSLHIILLDFFKTLMQKYLLIIILIGLPPSSKGQDIGSDKHYGNLAPNAIALDVDRFCSLSNGMCIVSKGDKRAMIDVNGNFIVPWGKYKFTANRSLEDCKEVFFYDGLVKVQDRTTSKIGYIDKTGKAIIPIIYDDIDYIFSSEMYMVPNKRLENLYYTIDSKGNKLFEMDNNKYSIKWKNPEANINLKDNKNFNRLLISKYTNERDYMYLYGYINRAGKVVIPATFHFANQFNEGMAAVGKKDEFGETKWGYIDSNGLLVIPYMFSKEPGLFHSGLALIEGTSVADFQYAYINKKGEIKIKVNGKASSPRLHPLTHDFEEGNMLGQYELGKKGYFFHGFSLWHSGINNFLLDTLGNFLTFDNFLAKHNYPILKNYRYVLHGVNDKGFLFTADIKDIYEDNRVGLIDFSGKVIFEPLWGRLEPDLFSTYSLATFILSEDKKNNKTVIREGIINSEGIYTVIKTEKKEVW